MKNNLAVKTIIFGLAFIFILNLNASAQGKYKISKSNVSFFSDGPVEDISGLNKESQGIIDCDEKKFFFKIPIKSFKFESSLMEDHFNENYMESEKYPDAIFKGAIEGKFDLKKDGQYPVNAVGELTIHGIPQKRTVPAIVIVKSGVPTVKSKFDVKLADHKIDIPTLVFDKIAEVVEVKIEASLAKL